MAARKVGELGVEGAAVEARPHKTEAAAGDKSAAAVVAADKQPKTEVVRIGGGNIPAPPPARGRSVVRREATIRSMNVNKREKEQFNYRASFKAPSGALIELQASNHSMFSDKHFQR